MPTKRLPGSANESHLKHQARDLLAAFRAGRMAAFQRIREFHPACQAQPDADIAARTFSLSDAYLTLAREYGYASWPRLKAALAEGAGGPALIHNERITDTAFAQALDFLDDGDVPRLRAHLAAHPGLVHQEVHFEGDNYFTKPTLLAFIAENPTRQNSLPGNIAEVARVILQAGAKDNQTALNETLGLVASGRVARECGVQNPLLHLLCDHGADPATALRMALGQGEFAAAETLIVRGAPVDLATAAALNRTDTLEALLPDADTEALQLALALAALHGHARIASRLLRAGADPNRYNPPGGHTHCTALHSAALSGHLDVVKAIIAAGGRCDIADIHHQATALQWADHANQTAVAAYLQAQVQDGPDGGSI